jgi:REP element-mobilizing transposase RayT
MGSQTTRQQIESTIAFGKMPAKQQVTWEIKELIEPYFSDASYELVSIHIDIPTLGRILQRKIANGLLKPGTLTYAQEFYDAITKARSGLVDAYELLITKFLHRLNQVLLGGSHKRFGKSLRSIRFYENQGKGFSNDSPNHLHMFLEIPSRLTRQKFRAEFKKLFSRLVYPLKNLNQNTGVLHITKGRAAGKCNHHAYVTKQFINSEIASDRLFFSGHSYQLNPFRQAS